MRAELQDAERAGKTDDVLALSHRAQGDWDAAARAGLNSPFRQWLCVVHSPWSWKSWTRYPQKPLAN